MSKLWFNENEDRDSERPTSNHKLKSYQESYPETRLFTSGCAYTLDMLHGRHDLISRCLQPALRHDHRAAELHLLDSIANHLVNDHTRRLLLVDHRSSFAHQERASILHLLIRQVIALCLKVVLDLQYVSSRISPGGQKNLPESCPCSSIL
jgi:hypothetical protein